MLLAIPAYGYGETGPVKRKPCKMAVDSWQACRVLMKASFPCQDIGFTEGTGLSPEQEGHNKTRACRHRWELLSVVQFPLAGVSARHQTLGEETRGTPEGGRSAAHHLPSGRSKGRLRSKA